MKKFKVEIPYDIFCKLKLITLYQSLMALSRDANIIFRLLCFFQNGVEGWLWYYMWMRIEIH